MTALTEMGPFKALQNGCGHVVIGILNAMGLPILAHMAKLVKPGTDVLTAVGAQPQVVENIPMKFSKVVQWGSSV